MPRETPHAGRERRDRGFLEAASRAPNGRENPMLEPARRCEKNRSIASSGRLDLESAEPLDPASLPQTFGELDLSPEMMRSLKRCGYDRPTPIQAALIPLALDDIDVLGQARTGTGKTAAFGISILEQIAPGDEIPGVQAMILVPTRELAVQVRDEIDKLATGQGVTVTAVYGGKPIRGQIEKLRRGSMIVVGTPGRILDHLSRRTIDLSELWCVVLDEADRMLDIGFRPEIEKILRQCPKEGRQTLLLSATIPPAIERLARRYMREPQLINVSPKEISGDTIEQFYYTVDHEDKFLLLTELLREHNPASAIIFCRTKRRTDAIARKLEKAFPREACAMHGDMAQTARDRVMKDYREKRFRFLVATDVVGRGIDISGISHIVNFDVPSFSDDYVHRVGRTGRMTKDGVTDGVAFTFIGSDEGGELTKIELRINRELKRLEVPESVKDQAVGRRNAVPDLPPPVDPLTKHPPKKYRRRL
jgi:ATP-dependent RNA helicase DeaD